MPAYRFKICLLSFLLAIAEFSNAQKNIVISDSLNANADKLNVKMGSQWFGKIWKFRFGEYAVVSSKLSWTTTSTKGNFFNTKTDSKSTEKFSFILSNKTDSASVNAAHNILVESLQEIELIPHFSWGKNELQKESSNFTAFIAINGDTSRTWALLMNVAIGGNSEGNYEAFLTNGIRKIFITTTSSNKKGVDTRTLPALGYEFIENGQSLCAVQYYGGGTFGMNKNIVWIHRELDTKVKLILAAAITAILQIKVTAPGF
jgi:hypothetical protein